MKGSGFAFALALGAVGCNSCGGTEPDVTSAEVVPEVAPTGVIEGVIKLSAGAELPSYPPHRAVADRGIPDGCPPRQRGDRQPVKQDGDGLRGVHVTVVSPGADLPPATPTTHEIVIDECRLTPPLLDATRGDEVVVKNESAFPFVPVLGRGTFGRAVLEGQTRTFPLEQGGVYPLTCGFSAACGRADVVVSYHPIHTQTSQGGRFRLVGVPAGSQELSAWHPLFAEKTQVVDVVEGETSQITLVIEPLGEEATEAESSASDADEPEAVPEDRESEAG